jgi:hypothetical protein
MKKMGVMVFAVCALVAGCGDDDNPTGPSNAPLVFTAQLSPANEVPPITNAESTARGATQISFNVTRDASNAITGASATFYFQVTGLPAPTNIIGAHIHPGAAGVNGPVIVSTGLTAAGPLSVPTGTTDYSVTVAADPAVVQGIINNPAGYYFNLHSPMNPGGVVRGQLMRTQ